VHYTKQTLVKFQRCMKCRATSRADFPNTTLWISCHGIRGVAVRSIISVYSNRCLLTKCTSHYTATPRSYIYLTSKTDLIRFYIYIYARSHSLCREKICILPVTQLCKSLSEKLINSVLFGSGHRRTWSRRHCSVQWRRAVAASQHALRVALHIVNIDFELN